ncbi:FTR1 family protein [Aneurinibacillus sp. Ricciae_BoGa-3]|uniref:FTR1 family iron permease n=1 Tax=Aneurinibacillus sp. Ricciae_BoGa-3 TaxID=3022697 RepID=UPI00234138C1|nr:FTR1 family protein [Aneurinibacillus sp. Ricciae_BoGa-3]WCK52817.1 FTR1 family protein [Aneurinibacillus sp. Ricciae_BoGa-3]
MLKKGKWLVLGVLYILFTWTVAAQASTGTDNMARAEQFINQALQNAKQGKLAEAQKNFEAFNKSWLQIEDSIKADSGKTYADVESKMGEVSYAFILNKPADVTRALEQLKTVNETYIQGHFEKGELKKSDATLSDFIGALIEAKQDVQKKDQKAALEQISKVRQNWLSVEGTVVAQSASIYSDSERDMVTVNAMLAQNPPDYQGAGVLLDRMINYLTPLSSKSGYTIWDAAMIPIREGLEALLVVTALLAFVSKSNNQKGKGWIWSGVLAGLLVSVILAVIVKFIFSSGAFGNNNFLISGWTGVIAAAMLLYMSYWLHSQSSIKDWQKYIRTKSAGAVDTGKLVSLGVLSFLAIFREGTETVLFLIGMVNQISLQNLLIGLLIGLVILAVVAYLMIVIGLKMPIKPFFMVSSVIVFYLCIKFTGMGIHGLQLGGLLPSTTASQLPSFDFLAMYPSWLSTVPQWILILAAILVVMWRKTKKNAVPNNAQYKSV